MALLGGRASNCAAVDEPPVIPKLAEPGDLAIIQQRYTSITPLTLKRDAHTDNRYGRFPHNQLLNRPLGTRWLASTGPPQSAGFVHALAPTPELWSLAMRHRTQIVYPHDAAIIALHLDLRPGSVLVECGTGSGSATAHFARVVAPHGTVHSFEFHQARSAAAASELALLVGSVANVRGGIDITKQGFVGVPDGTADAVFLDVPAPYVMGAEVRRVLKPNGVICTFSPCIEQVMRSVEMLRNGFHSVETLTARMRTYETREQVLDTPGFDEFGKSEETTNKHISGATHGNGADETETETEEQQQKRKRQKMAMASVTEKEMRRRGRTAGAERIAVSALGQGRHAGRVIRAAVRIHSKPFGSMKGHTSYLTFARRRREWNDADSEGTKDRAVGNEAGQTDWRRGSCDVC